jgi:hypothetical protein
MMHLRRLAWFIPSLLAAWLEAGPRYPFGRFNAADIARILSDTAIIEGDTWAWTEKEAAALGSFFEAALLAALATPLRPAMPSEELERRRAGDLTGASAAASLEADVEREMHELGRALETIELAFAMHVPIEPLVERWMAEPQREALEHLLAGFRSARADEAAGLLAFEVVGDRLAKAFLVASGPLADEIARAEALVQERLVFKRS